MSTDNSDIEAKVMVREWLLKQLGGEKNVGVLELFGGLGHIHDRVYTKVKKHMAFDVKKVNRPTWLQGDNRMLLKTRCKGWGLYDVDAYSNPWLICNDIHRLREPGRYGLAITDGILRSLNTGVVNGFVRQRIGLNGMPPAGLLTRWYPDIVQILVNDWSRFGIVFEKGKMIASKYSHLVTYYGVIVTKHSG